MLASFVRAVVARGGWRFGFHVLAAAVACEVFAQVPDKVDPSVLSKFTWSPPPGEAVRVEITRDTRISSYPGEEELNFGQASQVKFKSNQEFSLFDFDPKPFQGKIVVGATLHLRAAGDERLYRTTVSSIASPWTEGTGGGSGPEPGASSFHWRSHPNVPWGGDGDLTAVVFGANGSTWGMTEASPPDKDGWQVIPIDTAVIAARIAGLSEGLLVFDDVGSEWTKEGNDWKTRPFPNRMFFSREAGKAKAPFLTLYVKGVDHDPPEEPSVTLDMRTIDGLPVLVCSPSSKAEEGAPLAGYRLRVGEKERWFSAKGTSFGGRPQSSTSDPIRLAIPSDLIPTRGKSFSASLEAIDGAGNSSPAATIEIPLPAHPAPPRLELAEPPAANAAATGPRLARAEISVVDVLDKMHPIHGALEPRQPASYWTLNHLWDASKKQISLRGGRNEFVHFQVLLRVDETRSLNPTKVEFQWNDDEARINVAARTNPPMEFFRLRHVETQKFGAMPDPLIPLTDKFSIPAADEKIAGQRVAAIVGEVFIPHDAPVGVRRGLLRLISGQERLDLKVELEVWNFTLPDYLSFLPEMNCYDLPQNERDYYRLAHRHRTFVNRVPYSQNGEVAAGCAPHSNGVKLDFADWDRRFGPLLDGRAFKDLPRGNVPVDGFYLPLHENWPSKINDSYNGSYWADEGFTAKYRERFVDVSRQFTAHLATQKWNDTLFHVFLNNKNNFKERGWSRGSSPWLLDEPSHWQDYWALKFFGEAWRDGHLAGELLLSGKQMPANILYRCDISRPQWQRDGLDDTLGYNVVAGGPFLQYRQMVRDRAERFNQIVVVYGTANHPDASNVQGAAWCVDAWRLGADGVLPWQTVGTNEAWQNAEETSLFYPGEPLKLEGPMPSIRLKSYLRGQQDVEYLTMWLLQNKGLTRDQLGQQVAELLKLRGQREGTSFTGAEDAGRIAYTGLTPQALWQLRTAVGQKLHQAKPEPKRRLVTWPRGPVATIAQ
jgi:hypothetical protein